MKLVQKTGIIYIASGEKYLAEAHFNAFHSKYFCPDVPFAIYTDCLECVDDSVFEFKFCLTDVKHSYRDKIVPLLDPPFERCLFLDSDAKLSYSPNDIFSLLDTFDICAAHAPVRIPPGWSDCDVPSIFPELNTGVILFRNTSIVRHLMSDWLRLYDELFLTHGQTWDQASFRSVLFSYVHNLRVRFFVMPPECNLRTTKPWIVGRGLPAYIIHGRFDSGELPDFLYFLNSDIDRFRSVFDWIRFYPSSSIRPRFDRSFN